MGKVSVSQLSIAVFEQEEFGSVSISCPILKQGTYISRPIKHLATDFFEPFASQCDVDASSCLAMSKTATVTTSFEAGTSIASRSIQVADKL